MGAGAVPDAWLALGDLFFMLDCLVSLNTGVGAWF